MEKKKLYGIRNEVDGLKMLLNDLQVAVSQLDYDMRRDMDLLQRKVIGLESRLQIDGGHEFYTKYNKKKYARPQKK